MNNYIKLAQIKRIFGLHGKIKIKSFTEPKENVFEIKPLYIIDDKTKEIEIKNEGKYKDLFIISIKNIDTIYEAEKINKKYIYANETSLPKLNTNELYWFQLLGLDVVDENNNYHGKIEDVFYNNTHDVLIINNISNKKKLVPYIFEKYIKSVDINNNKVIIKNCCNIII